MKFFLLSVILLYTCIGGHESKRGPLSSRLLSQATCLAVQREMAENPTRRKHTRKEVIAIAKELAPTYDFNPRRFDNPRETWPYKWSSRHEYDF